MAVAHHPAQMGRIWDLPSNSIYFGESDRSIGLVSTCWIRQGQMPPKLYHNPSFKIVMHYVICDFSATNVTLAFARWQKDRRGHSPIQWRRAKWRKIVVICIKPTSFIDVSPANSFASSSWSIMKFQVVLFVATMFSTQVLAIPQYTTSSYPTPQPTCILNCELWFLVSSCQKH